MAGGTIGPKTALVLILGSMAGITIRGSAFVDSIDMTALTDHTSVFSGQSET